MGNSHLRRHAREAGFIPNHRKSVFTANDESFSEYLSHAGATVTSTINSDL